MAAVVARRARRLIAVSPYIERHFRRAMHYRGDITVVPNLLSTSLSPSFGGELIPNKCPPGSGTAFITVLSSWSALKNGAAAIRAFAEARTRLTNSSLTMIGHGFGPGGPAERWAAERHIAEGITFVGPLPHDLVLDALAKADILVHPALEESYGMVIGEAQLAGVPVIGGARSGGVPWALDYNHAGRLVDVRSSSSIAAAMVELALDPRLGPGWRGPVPTSFAGAMTRTASSSRSRRYSLQRRHESATYRMEGACGVSSRCCRRMPMLHDP